MTTQAKLLNEFDAACAELQEGVEAALSEKITELNLRAFWKALPHSRLKEDQLESYLQHAFGPQADIDYWVSRLPLVARGPRLGTEEVLQLEATQNYRCALCGVPLSQVSQPQVDHKVPIALRGASDFGNYQLLCRVCNQGKSGYLHWVMAAPFFLESVGKVSFKLRFCVLSRDNSLCTEVGCGETSRTSELQVIPRIPVQSGGRLIFDNLRTVCNGHQRTHLAALVETAKLRLRSAARFVPVRPVSAGGS